MGFTFRDDSNLSTRSVRALKDAKVFLKDLRLFYTWVNVSLRTIILIWCISKSSIVQGFEVIGVFSTSVYVPLLGVIIN